MAVDGGNSDDEELDGLMLRGVLRGPTRFSTASVGGVQERVHCAAASREHANVGRRSVAGGGNAEEYDSEAMPGVTPIGSMSRDEGIAPNYGYFRFTPDKIIVPRPLEGRHDLSTWTESIEPQLEIAQLKRFIDGTTPIPPARALAHLSQFRAMQLLTFTTISRCCSPTVQIALKACRVKVDAGYQAWQFIMRTYMAKDDLYIGQLEQALTNLEMGEHKSATSYCNRAQQILVNLRTVGVDYSQASYITHVVKGLPQQYNLLRKMLELPQVRKELDEDTLASYIIEEECTLAAEGRKDQFLPQANQQPKNGGGAGGGGEKWKGGKDGQPNGGKGGFKGKCYVCGQTGHVAKYCQQWADKEADAGGEGSGGSSGKGGDGSKGSGQSSCAMVKPVVEQTPLVVLEPEAREGLQAVAAAVKANPSVVLLDSGCSHHLMGDRSAFVEMSSGGSIKQVTGFNGALQEVQGRGTVALLGEGGKRVLVPDVLYVPGVQASLLSAGQLGDIGVQVLDAGDVTLLWAPDGSLLGRAEFKGRVICTNFQPCSTQQQEGEMVALHTLATGVRSKGDLWHARMAHVGIDAIERSAAHGSVKGLDLEKGGKSGIPCVSCVGGKITRHTFPSVGEEEDELLGVVHADLCGPFREAAKDGSRYFLKWLPMAERQCKTTVQALRTDRGGEFLGHDFTLFLDGKGIIHDLTCPRRRPAEPTTTRRADDDPPSPGDPPSRRRPAEPSSTRRADDDSPNRHVAAPPPSRTPQWQPSRGAAKPLSSSRAAQLLPSRPAAAEPPSGPEPPSSSRAAQQQPSRPAAAEPPSSSRAAQQQPSSPGAAELPSDHRATQPTLPDDLQLFLQCDRADGLSLFDLTSGASPAPAADADPTVRSQWATRDAAARLAVRRHLPTTERAHFSQCKTAQALYDAVVARYSSPATAALSRLALPFLFPDLAAFPTVADLITHLRTIDARYCAALPADFCAKNPPPMYLTLYFLVTRLSDSLRVVRDHFLAVCPTTLTVDNLETALLAAEQSIVAVGASRGDPRTPIFEGCSPSPLLPSVASAVATDLGGLESVGAASAPSGRRRPRKGKGGKGAGGASGGGGGGVCSHLTSASTPPLTPSLYPVSSSTLVEEEEEAEELSLVLLTPFPAYPVACGGYEDDYGSEGRQFLS
ncbi:unnamed protein product [Closterium sp. NIES-53]